MSGLHGERSSLLSAALGSRCFRLAASVTALALGLALVQVAEPAIAPTAAAAEAPAPEAVDSAPDAISARLAAARQGTPVEIEDARTSRTTTFALPNGTKQVEAHYSDIRVIKDGEWSPISTDLEESDGTLVPEATRAQVEIAAAGDTDAPLARLSQDGTSLALDWRTDLPDAEVDGATATFDTESSEQVEVTATNEGFNLRVRLDQAPTKAPVYRLPITTEGLTVRKQPDGSFAGIDADGEIDVVIDAPVMWDSNPATMTEAGQTERVPVDAELVTVNGKQELRLRPAMSYLTDPARVYPVWVDPDVSTQDSARDAYIREGQPTSSAASTAWLNVGWNATALRQRALIQHDALPTLPAGSIVLGGKLSLRQWDAYTCTAKAINAYPIDESWSSSVTWNTRPGYSTAERHRDARLLRKRPDPPSDYRHAAPDLDPRPRNAPELLDHRDRQRRRELVADRSQSQPLPR